MSCLRYLASRRRVGRVVGVFGCRTFKWLSRSTTARQHLLAAVVLSAAFVAIVKSVWSRLSLAGGIVGKLLSQTFWRRATQSTVPTLPVTLALPRAPIAAGQS